MRATLSFSTQSLESGRSRGHTFSQPDLIIGATALLHGLTVVSRDKSDYEEAGVSVFSPWTDRLSAE